MNTPYRSRRRVFRLWLLLGLAVLVIVGATTAASSAPSLATVSTKTLIASGISLENPGLFTATTIGKGQAEGLAVGRSTTTVVRESLLARVHTQLLQGRLCWVVSIMPAEGIWSYGPIGSKPMQGTWDIEFIDATTGEHLGGYDGGPVP